ncbi:MAG: four helix bundle protein [Gemmatimonadaceae bacterium]
MLLRVIALGSFHKRVVPLSRYHRTSPKGANRASDRDFAKFVQVAIASASELETQLEYARDTRVLKRRDVSTLLVQVVEVRTLYGLLKRLREPPPSSDPGDPEYPSQPNE